MNGLFRKQAVDAQSQRLYGEISLAQPLSIYFAAFAIVAAVAAVVIFLSFSEYARKETVRGYLVPDRGLLKVFATKGGLVESVIVKEGDRVKKGQVISRLAVNNGTSSGQELSTLVIEQYKNQLNAIEEEIITNQALAQKETQRAKTSIKDIKLRLSHIQSLKATISDRLRLQKKRFEQQKELFTQGYLPLAQLQESEQSLLTVQQDLYSADNTIAELESDKNVLISNLNALPENAELKFISLKKQKADLIRVINETKTNFRYVVKAPHDGIIASSTIMEGETISPNRVMFTVIPEEATLVAELLVPTRSSGFIKPGHKARLRFDAFPYQRFGFEDSEVTRVDKAIVLGSELDLPISLNEPVFRVRTVLDRQHISAFGQEFPLKSGMLLEADIMLERRTLLEWLLDPIYSLKGRIS